MICGKQLEQCHNESRNVESTDLFVAQSTSKPQLGSNLQEWPPDGKRSSGFLMISIEKGQVLSNRDLQRKTSTLLIKQPSS